MGYFTHWFLAPVGDAEAIASTLTTEERSADDWPNLSIHGFSEIDLLPLARALLGLEAACWGPLLYRSSDENLIVYQLNPKFIDRLAAVNATEIPTLARAATEADAGQSPEEIEPVLRQLTEFARRAQAENLPVLSLSVL